MTNVQAQMEWYATELAKERKRAETLQDENETLRKLVAHLQQEYDVHRLAEIHMNGYRRGINVLADRIQEIIQTWRTDDDEAIPPADNNAGPKN